MAYRGIKVLVTGADGFIGSHLAERLVESGADVTALCHYSSLDTNGWVDDISKQTRREMQVIRGDVRDAAFVRRLMKGQQIVFHLAALIAIPHSYMAPQSYLDTNVTGTLNVLEAAHMSGTERIVHTSTSEVYGTAITVPITEEHPLQGQSPYSASKIGADMMAEAFARSFDLPVCVLRPFNCFGPRQSERAVIPTVIRQMLDPACEVLRVGDTTTVRDFTFVTDTVAAFHALGTAEDIAFGQPYNAGSGRGVSIAELIQLIGAVTGVSKPVETDTRRMRPSRSEVRALLADNRRIVADVGWTPCIDLQDGLAQTAAWWRDRLDSGRARRESDFIL